MGCLGALPIFLVSVLLEKSGVDFFRKIDQDTKLYVVQVFGAERNWPVRFLLFSVCFKSRRVLVGPSHDKGALGFCPGAFVVVCWVIFNGQ